MILQVSDSDKLSHDEIQDILNIANEVAEHTRQGELGGGGEWSGLCGWRGTEGLCVWEGRKRRARVSWGRKGVD